MSLPTLWRPSWLALLLVTLLASPLATAQDAGRADVQDAIRQLDLGETLSPMQRALLGEVGYAIPEPMTILDLGRYSLASPVGDAVAETVDPTPGRLVPPDCAVLNEPLDMATGLDGLIRMRATAATTGGVPTGYKYFIGTNNPPTNIANGNVFTSANVVLSGTTPNTTYYWQVVPTNADGDATGCPIWRYTTKPLGFVNTFPYVQDFENTSNSPGGDGTVINAGRLADWYNRAGGSDFWRSVASSESQPTYGAPNDHTTGTGRYAWLDDSQTPIAANAQWWMPAMDLTALPNPRLRFWYQNVAEGNTTITDLSVLNVLVSTNGGATFAVASTIDTRVNTWTEFTVSLGAYVSASTIVAFSIDEHPTGFQSDPSLDDVTVDQGPSTPIFALSPMGPTDFGTAGACFGTTSAAQTYTVTNNGAGTLNVTGATLTGANAGQFVLDASSLPAMLTSGQSADVIVTFQPMAGVTGPQTATLTLSYNDGTAQTVMVTLTATATDVNANGGTGAGIAFANDNGGACAPTSGPQPTSTALVPVTGHVKITAADWDSGTGDDSYEDIDAAELAAAGVPFIRAFGRNTSNVWITSNGNVLLNPTTYASATDRNLTLPSTFGGGVIAATTLDLNFSTTFAADNTGVLGTPGVYYGSGNPDGDAYTDFVVTWWHAYRFGSAVYPAATARFLTAQLIVYGGPENEDSRVEIRFPDGNDANGVPYQQNANDPTIANEILVGIGNADGTASAEYHEDTAGGPISDGDGVAVLFTPETQGLADGAAGWRLMGAPVTNYTVGRLAELNLVQSVVGQYPSFAFDNLYTNYNGTAFQPATDVADALAPGQGFFWYLFDLDIDPTAGPTPATDGDSESYTLPMMLQGTGQEATADPVAVPLHAVGNGWNMVANPFRSSLSVVNLASWANGGTLVSGVGQVWNPNAGTTGGQAGSYVTTTTLGNVVTAWQGMFVQNNSATSIDVPASAKTTGGTFVGRGGQAASLLGFELSGTTPDGAPTVDVAAVVAFADDATPTWDLLDTGKLTPVVDRYATAAFVGERDGTSRAQAQMSLPSGVAAQYTLPVVIEAVGTTADLTLAWPRMDNVPDTWTLELRDLVTGDVVDLRTATRYAFTVTPSAAREGTPADWAAATTLASEAGVATAARFEVVISTGNVVAGSQDMPTVFALDRVAPNPTASASTVRFAMPDAGAVSVSVYDLLGREVATLAQGEMAAGWHTASIDASRLSAGVYVVRMQAGSFQATQRMTVVR